MASQALGLVETVALGGQAAQTGVSASATVTVNVHVAVLPAPSVAVKELVVTPTAKLVPLAPPAVCAVVAEQLSTPAGVVYTNTAPQSPASLMVLAFGGHVIVGSSVSLTVTVNAQVAELLTASVARKVLVVTPTGKDAPLAKPALCVDGAPAQ
jgi:hypothetical protein